jgi:putative spermidine/putrescine transport system ATP-binding protein
MQMELRRIHCELGVTMIYVTHDQTEAMAMSDRIAVFNQGRIEETGTPGEVYFAPRTRFVESFIGDSNLFEGRSLADGIVEIDEFGPIATGRLDLAQGADVSVLVRPETIRLRREAIAPSPTGNTIAIEEIVNYGDSFLVVGKKAGLEIHVRVPSIDMPELERGLECGIEWSPARVHVIVAGARTELGTPI